MIKFENERVFGARPIDYVIGHIVQNTNTPANVMMKILGDLCKLLTYDQQKALVDSLNVYVETSSYKVSNQWLPVEASEE